MPYVVPPSNATRNSTTTRNVLQEAQLSQRGRTMFRVFEYFAKSLKVIQNDTPE